MPTATPPTNTKILDDIITAIKKGKTFCLSGHQNPDADVVGSQLAMASLIRRLGADKKISILNCGTPPKNLAFLPGFKDVQSVEKAPGTYDVVIVFECSGADRMGNVIDFKTQAKTVINIDHHLHNPNFGHINFVEPTTSSTSEIIFKIFEQAGETLTKDEASCLYMGMTADTGWFRYGNTNSQTHQIASKMLEVGVPVSDLAERAHMSRSERALRLLGWVLTNMRMEKGNKIAVLSIPLSITEKLGVTSDDFDEIVNAGLMCETAQASALFKEKENDVVKISLRSKGQLNINQVARQFGGGGHMNASGCAIEKPLKEAEELVLAELKKIV